MKKEDKKTNVSEKGDLSTQAGKTLRGVVVSDKMQETVVVAVTRFVKHPKYRKFIKRVKKFHAHDPGNTKTEGDKVTIKECKPISKKKRFIVVEK